jgi:GT2 family glycosyltransferase
VPSRTTSSWETGEISSLRIVIPGGDQAGGAFLRRRLHRSGATADGDGVRREVRRKRKKAVTPTGHFYLSPFLMISIAICTYNNAGTLAVVLESLRSLACPAALSYEILVIDNNSTDETKEVVFRWQPVWGNRLRYIFEGCQGLSHARNRAWQEAHGDVVSYLDDDVKVDSGWLAAVAAAFEEHSAAVVGGRSRLIYPAQRPSWLPEKYETLLSRLDYGEQVIVNTDQPLFGLNFSVRKEWLDRIGGFDVALGRYGRSLTSGEEFDLLRRIRAQGGIAVYEPRAVVGHLVPAARVKKRWFLRRLWVAGAESVILAAKHGDALPTLGEASVHAIRCCGSIGKGIALGDWSWRSVVDRGLVAAYALGRLGARLRLARRIDDG